MSQSSLPYKFRDVLTQHVACKVDLDSLGEKHGKDEGSVKEQAENHGPAVPDAVYQECSQYNANAHPFNRCPVSEEAHVRSS